MSIPPSDLLRKEANQQEVARIDMQNGSREAHLGRTSHPRGIANAWLRCCRTHGISLGPEGPERFGKKESMEGILEEPSGSHRLDGLVHLTHRHLRDSLLLLSHRPRPSAHAAFQPYAQSDEPMDRATVPRGIPVQGPAQIPDPLPRQEVWAGCDCCHSRNGKHAQENFIPKPLAEWSCRALRGELPPRFARSCDRAQREAPETPSQRIGPLLSRRPHTLRTRQGDYRVKVPCDAA